jgi:hypothetical protein
MSERVAWYLPQFESSRDQVFGYIDIDSSMKIRVYICESSLKGDFILEIDEYRNASVMDKSLLKDYIRSTNIYSVMNVAQKIVFSIITGQELPNAISK